MKYGGHFTAGRIFFCISAEINKASNFISIKLMKVKPMKAVIMAGGEGTRLRPLTCGRPKPMVPVANKPVMEHILDLLKKHGMTNVAATLQYMPDIIREILKTAASST